MPIQPKQQPPYYQTGQQNIKEYKALFTQTGTSAPNPIILSNTIGTIVWTRDSVGSYLGTLDGAFDDTKTLNNIFGEFNGIANTYIPISDQSSITGYYTMYLNSSNEIWLITVDETFTPIEYSTLLTVTKLPINIQTFPNV